MPKPIEILSTPILKSLVRFECTGMTCQPQTLYHDDAQEKQDRIRCLQLYVELGERA